MATKFTVIGYKISDFNQSTNPDSNFDNIIYQLNNRTIWIINQPLKHGDTFTETSPKKIYYLKKNYVNISNPLLSVEDIAEAETVACKALSLNGIDSYLSLPESLFSAWNNLSAGTISFWFNLNSFNANNGFGNFSDAFFCKQHNSVNSYSIFGLTTNSSNHYLNFQLKNGVTLNGDTDISLETWYQAAVTWDGSHIILYLNGVSDGSISSSNILEDDAGVTSMQIGAWTATSAYINGLMDEFVLFNRCLSSDEINTIYNQGLSDMTRSPWNDGLIAGYHMSDATDFTGNGFDGSLINATIVHNSINC